MIKDILILVGQNLFAESLSESIKNSKKGRVVKIFSCREEMLMFLKEKYEVILILNEIDFSHGNFSFINEILEINVHTKLLVLSSNIQIKNIRKLFELGVKCYLEEGSTVSDLLKAIETIENNNIYINESLKQKMMSYICCEENKKHTNYELTSRELDVLKYICEGLNGKEISDKLYISANTVETHRRNIMMKLNVKNSIGMVKYALEQNIV